jgi:glycosyltransferase involved in cell wall biosynthesis
MANATAITGTIITLDEEDRIAGAISSLSCCDEVIVVDCGSTDRTRQIAVQCGARVIVHDWKGYADQKNFAAAEASHDWVLSIDADERVSVELAIEIAAWKQAPRGAGGSMPRRAFYLGRWIRHSGWYPDRKVRLYDRRLGRWEGDFVHEKLALNGEPVPLSGDLLHLPYRDWNDHIRRIDRYTQLAAQSSKSSGQGGNAVRLIASPPLSFLKTFVLRAGFLDGWRGAVIAYAAARYTFLRELRRLK